MATKKQKPRRRSLNDRLDAEIASAESITVAGITTEERQPAPTKPEIPQPTVKEKQQSRGEVVHQEEKLLTKKATTIMPKEVFSALQRYCTDTDTPKHRALYLFLIDGLRATGTITDKQYRNFRDMAAQLTTTYEKK